MHDINPEGYGNTESEPGRLEQATLAQGTIADRLDSSDLAGAKRNCIAIYGGTVGRYCMACLGDQAKATRIADEVIENQLTLWSARSRAELTLRAHLLLCAKKRCAVEQTDSFAPAGGKTEVQALEARRLLSELRPSERELLTLRLVCGLSYRELGMILGVQEAEVILRLSLALAEACYATDPRITTSFASNERKEFIEQLALLVDRTADERLRLRVAEDDRLRDELHVATQVARRLSRAAEDFAPGIPELSQSATSLPPVPQAATLTGTVVMSAIPAPQTAEATVPAATVPVATAPAATVPVATAPAATVPVATAPVATAPVATAPVATVPVATVPVATAPVATVPVATVPEGNAAGDNAAGDNAAGDNAVAGNAAAGNAAAGVVPLAPFSRKQAWLVGGVMAIVLAGGGLWVSQQIPATAVSLAGKRPVDAVVSEVSRETPTSRVEVCAPSRGPCRPATKGQKLKPSESIRTRGDGSARVSLAQGAEIEMERGSELVLTENSAAGVQLASGGAVVDVPSGSSERVSISTPLGVVESAAAKYLLRAETSQLSLQVMRGKVELADLAAARVEIQAGQQGVIEGKGPPRAISNGAYVASNTTPNESQAEPEAMAASRGLGQVSAKKPSENKERPDAVQLTRHRVTVNIVGAIARTEIEEVFSNSTNEALEGIFRFPLPADAQIDRLALDVDGKLEEAAFVDRDRAAAIWRGNIVNAAPQMRSQIKDDIVWVPGPWRDPALLEWQRGNQFELRIYPIPKLGQRRIVLAYTQVLKEAFGRRHYQYPLPNQLSQARPIDDFDVEVRLRSHDPDVAPEVKGYSAQSSVEAPDVRHFRLHERRFVPQGDLDVAFALPNRDKAVLAWAHRPENLSESSYLAMLVRPSLPPTTMTGSRNLALVIDVSRSMYGENLRRATRVAEKILGDLRSDDRVSLLACHSRCDAFEPSPKAMDTATLAEQRKWLKGLVAEGASDPALAVETALNLANGDRDKTLEVVYLGDGVPTVGAVRPHALEATVRSAFGSRNARFTAIAVGAESDMSSLRALARGAKGTVLSYVPGTSAAELGAQASNSLMGTRLEDVEVELPPGVRQVSDLEHVLPSGQEMIVAARFDGAVVRGDVVVRGRIQSSRFEQRYPLEVTARDGQVHAFVPRLYAAARIARLDGENDPVSKKEAIELSQRYSVASRYTSLLVLESQAMFKAFGLDNGRKTELWTGELESESSSSEEASTLDAAAVADDAESKDKKAQGEGLPSPKAPSVRARASAKASPSDESAASPSMVARGAGDSMQRASSAGSRSPAMAPAAPEAALRQEETAPLRIEDMPRPIPPRRPMIPMRRVWERQGKVLGGTTTPSQMSPERIAKAEAELQASPDSRARVKALFDGYVAIGDYRRADKLAVQWNERDPFDVEALVARADSAARDGNRALAIRILGSVIDVRPSDVGAQLRMARLLRWQGDERSSCRVSLGLAAFRLNDVASVADALRCSVVMAAGSESLAILRQELLRSLDDATMKQADSLSQKPLAPDALSGDVRLVASWDGASGADLDLALIDPDGHRISWLGAPSRSVISALDVSQTNRESLALRGGKPGDYVIEISRVRSSNDGRSSVAGRVDVVVAGTQKSLNFRVSEQVERIGVIRITTVPKLVPVYQPMAW